MEWRPEGWDNPYKKNSEYAIGGEKAEDAKRSLLFATGVYEAGADAILKALKEKSFFITGVQNATDDPVLKFGIPNERGWLAFIPEKGG